MVGRTRSPMKKPQSSTRVVDEGARESVMRSSYRPIDVVDIPRSVSPTERAQKLKEQCALQRSRSPPFRGLSNYEFSFQAANAVGPGHQSPPRNLRKKFEPVPSPSLVFVETSTSRSSYLPPSPADFPEKAPPPKANLSRSVAFTATSESRKAFVQHDIKSVPPRHKEFHRVLPKVPFQATTTSAATFTGAQPSH